MLLVSRLLRQLEQLKQSWFECQQRVRHKTVLSTIELIESWTEVSIFLSDFTIRDSGYQSCLVVAKK